MTRGETPIYQIEKFLSNTDLDSGLVDYFLGDFTTPPSLGIPIMASWTPPDVEIELIDDNSGDLIDYDAPTDLVAIIMLLFIALTSRTKESTSFTAERTTNIVNHAAS